MSIPITAETPRLYLITYWCGCQTKPLPNRELPRVCPKHDKTIRFKYRTYLAKPRNKRGDIKIPNRINISLGLLSHGKLHDLAAGSSRTMTSILDELINTAYIEFKKGQI